MKVKCVGGICDGYTISIDGRYHKDDYVKVPIKVTFDLNDLYLHPYKMPDVSQAKYAYYKIVELQYKNPDYLLTFLTPPEWSIPQALAHLIGFHHGVSEA